MDHFYGYLFVAILNIMDVIKQLKNVFVQKENLIIIVNLLKYAQINISLWLWI